MIERGGRVDGQIDKQVIRGKERKKEMLTIVAATGYCIKYVDRSTDRRRIKQKDP